MKFYDGLAGDAGKKHNVEIIGVTLTFGPGVPKMSQQLLDAGVNPKMIEGEPTKHMDACQDALEVLDINNLISQEEKEVIARKLCEKISKYCEKYCSAGGGSPNN